MEPGEWSKRMLSVRQSNNRGSSQKQTESTKKSRWPESFYPRVLKELADKLALPITHLFNKSIEKGSVPEDWTQAEVCAIFKNGEKSDPWNYRSIPLTSVLCKILESFVTGAIQGYMESLGLYSECQHGFRNGKSCVTQVLEVIENFHQLRQDRRRAFWYHIPGFQESLWLDSP